MLRQLPSRLFRYWNPTHVVSMLSACWGVKCQVEARDAVPCINEPVDAGRFLFECKDLEESHWRVLGIHGKVKIVIGCEVSKTLTSLLLPARPRIYHQDNESSNQFCPYFTTICQYFLQPGSSNLSSQAPGIARSRRRSG